MSHTESFVFLESWYTMIRHFEDEGNLEIAEKLAHQIITYGITGRITTDNAMIRSLVSSMCVEVIDKSKNRYKACVANGKKGGRDKKFNDQKIRDMKAQGKSNDEIAEELGCTIRTVQRALGATLENYGYDDDV